MRFTSSEPGGGADGGDNGGGGLGGGGTGGGGGDVGGGVSGGSIEAGIAGMRKEAAMVLAGLSEIAGLDPPGRWTDTGDTDGWADTMRALNISSAVLTAKHGTPDVVARLTQRVAEERYGCPVAGVRREGEEDANGRRRVLRRRRRRRRDATPRAVA